MSIFVYFYYKELYNYEGNEMVQKWRNKSSGLTVYSSVSQYRTHARDVIHRFAGIFTTLLYSDNIHPIKRKRKQLSYVLEVKGI